MAALSGMIRVGVEGVDSGSLLAGLDEDQRQAALALSGPVGILAGAGSGKTRTITHRIAYGVRTGVYDPSRVLALTFTTRAAGELRGRLSELAAPTVQARTFHSAALRQLMYFWGHTIGGAPPKVVAAKGEFLGAAARRVGVSLAGGLLRAVAEEIEWRKVTERTMAAYATALDAGERRAPGRLTNDQLVQLLEAYEDAKDAERVIDFEDVLLATAGMLETEPWVSEQVRSQYRHFVVDEYQDVSPLQHHLLRLWLGERRDLCVVGDPAQTIYSFTGATSRYLIDFARDHPGARMVELHRNYRSQAPIVGVANALGDHIPAALELEAQIPSTRRTPPLLFGHDDDAAQARAIATSIRQRLVAGEKAWDIAVLVRTNAQIPQLAEELARNAVPVRTSSTRPFFQQPSVQATISALRAAVVGAQAGGPLVPTVSDVLRARGWRNDPPATFGPERDAWAAMDAIMRLADAQPPGTSVAEFSAQLDRRSRLQHEPEIEAVTVSTMHAVKGLEFERVYVAGLRDGLVPLLNSAGTQADAVEEERRLAYVAVTRARSALELHWAKLEGQGAPSRFVAELGSRIRDGNPGARGG